MATSAFHALTRQGEMNFASCSIVQELVYVAQDKMM